jgi:hypothetical protein
MEDSPRWTSEWLPPCTFLSASSVSRNKNSKKTLPKQSLIAEATPKSISNMVAKFQENAKKIVKKK